MFPWCTDLQQGLGAIEFISEKMGRRRRLRSRPADGSKNAKFSVNTFAFRQD